MDCTVIKRLFPALMAGDLPAAESAQPRVTEPG